MFRRKILFLSCLTSALLLNGCGYLNFMKDSYVVDNMLNNEALPDKNGDSMYKKKQIDTDSIAFKNAYKEAKNDKSARNELLSRMILLSDQICEEHKGAVMATSASINIGLGFSTSLLTGLGTVLVNPAVKTALSAGATLTNASRSIINEEVYRNSYATNIIKAIEISRNEKLTNLKMQMEKNIAVPGGGASKSADTVKTIEDSIIFINTQLEIVKAASASSEIANDAASAKTSVEKTKNAKKAIDDALAALKLAKTTAEEAAEFAKKVEVRAENGIQAKESVKAAEDTSAKLAEALSAIEDAKQKIDKINVDPSQETAAIQLSLKSTLNEIVTDMNTANTKTREASPLSQIAMAKTMLLKSTGAYGIDEGIRDVMEYHLSCSFSNGLKIISEAIDKRSPTKTEIKARINMLQEQLKQNDSLIQQFAATTDNKNELKKKNAKILETILDLDNQLINAPD